MGDRQQGFSLLELMLVLVIFLVVTGAVFTLLDTAQTRYRAEQQFLESFQGARLGVELMVRDIHNAGYPPPYTFAGNLAKPPTPPAYPAGTWTVPTLAAADLQRRFAVGIVGIDASGVNPNCTVNGGANPCTIPNAWDLMLELDIDPENPNPDPVTGLNPQVEWVRYNLLRAAGAPTSILFRTVTPKVPGTNPAAAQDNVPFVENVVQDPTPGAPAPGPPLFTYECDPNQILVPGTQICLAEHVKNVYISLRVQSTRRDIQTGQFRQITVQGAASRLNPSR